jgi:hypothetical protein
MGCDIRPSVEAVTIGGQEALLAVGYMYPPAEPSNPMRLPSQVNNLTDQAPGKKPFVSSHARSFGVTTDRR